jgi:hypothetical protein
VVSGECVDEVLFMILGLAVRSEQFAIFLATDWLLQSE